MQDFPQAEKNNGSVLKPVFTKVDCRRKWITLVVTSDVHVRVQDGKLCSTKTKHTEKTHHVKEKLSSDI